MPSSAGASTRAKKARLFGRLMCPVDALDLGKFGRKDTPLRMITPRGRTSETAFAAESLPEWFRLLEDYCGVPLPYEKQDHMTMPGLPAPGVEHAGLITYSEPYQLAPTHQESADFKWFCADISAHEMAHLWFGDLVGITWWKPRR